MRPNLQKVRITITVRQTFVLTSYKLFCKRVKNFFSFIRNQHINIYKALIIISAIGAIAYIFPKQGKFKYELSNLKGKPWAHEKLIAPFDFAIHKTTVELDEERIAITEETRPYFKRDNQLVKKQIDKFNSNFQSAWVTNNTLTATSSKEPLLVLGNIILSTIYKHGIISPNERIENQKPSFTINLLTDNIEEEHELAEFFTINTAQEYIQNALEKKATAAEIKFLLPLLDNSIAHSVKYDKEISEKVIEQALSQISETYGVIVRDQPIISNGEFVDDQKLQILYSLKLAYEEQSGGGTNSIVILIGQLVIITFCMLILLSFLSLFRKDIFSGTTHLLFILLMIILEVLMAKLATTNQAIDVHLIPFCILPIIIRSFYDTRIALFVHLTTVLIIAFMVPSPFEFVFMQVIGGIVVIFSIINLHKRSQIFISSTLLFATYSCTYLSLTITQTGGLDSIKWITFVWFAASSILILFAYPLIFIFENTFGFISDVSMLELSDTNGKLLRKLASKAPGTFQHSLQVANLAEGAIFAIGGNALLVRTGALYHDLGKMENPIFFIENQANQINPHDDMSYEDSAKTIINHVLTGIEIAKKNNLPEQVIDFIRTHHGTTITGYFYNSLKNEFPDQEIDENDFRYPGPIPFSKETAVLMMADSVEAASRSLKEHSATTISNLVDNIIDSQINQQQFINADITFKNINTIKKIFKKKLMNIYHVRVEYPR